MRNEKSEKYMPSKHIDEQTWRKVEKETVRAVTSTAKPFKDTEVLKLLILKGIQEIKEEDYKKHAERK
ncbi:MAG: hypothetical protein VX952_12980 [Pseudomonadota bacterium]|jgi:hypothetical protein|nr:hypothetical protein [Pseudomonadota bacterium]